MQVKSLDKAARCAAILEEAVRTFAQFGVAGTDVQVIADRAGVGKGTVYRHFGNKEELFWATAAYVDERFFATLFEATHGETTPEAKLRATGQAYAAFFEENPAFLEVFVRSRAEFRGEVPEAHLKQHEQAIGVFGEIFQQGMDQGEFTEMPIREIVYSFGAVLYGTVVMNCYVTPARPMTEMIQYTIDVFIKGIQSK